MNIQFSVFFQSVTPILQHQIRHLVSLFLLVLVSWQAASLLWLLLTPALPAPTMQPNARDDHVVAMPVTLFGQTQPHDHRGESAQAFADASVLQGWVLLGVVLDNEFRMALVQQGQNGALSWLKEGQRTTQGLAVVSIEARRVQLMTRQGLSVLTLTPQTVNESQKQSSATQPLAATAALQQLRANIKQNPSNAMSMMRLDPQFSAGKLTGVLMSPGAGHEALFAALGLKAGDILLSLNGENMQAWMGKIGALPSVLDGQGAQAKVFRAGKEIDIVVSW